ncbi:MAG: fructose 1,6-bisphosphatase, partial [Nitrosarchaeum sp.]|nr:fructose 1,6-bisphosphatase [Nitrosarchaeum sp.]
PIVEALVFSMHNGKFTGPFDGFSTPDWDLIRETATKKALSIRSQGFIHPATLVPSELEYAEGYRARMDVLESKMKAMEDASSHTDRKQNYEDPD